MMRKNIRSILLFNFHLFLFIYIARKRVQFIKRQERKGRQAAKKNENFATWRPLRLGVQILEPVF